MSKRFKVQNNIDLILEWANRRNHRSSNGQRRSWLGASMFETKIWNKSSQCWFRNEHIIESDLRRFPLQKGRENGFHTHRHPFNEVEQIDIQNVLKLKMFQSDDLNSWYDHLCDNPVLSTLSHQLILQRSTNADNNCWNEHGLNNVLVWLYDL
jgi:hypothetical protein